MQGSMDLFEPWRNQPPARHALESDSEDEVDAEDVHNVYEEGSSSRRRTTAVHVKPELKYTNEEPPKGLKLVIAVDEGGQFWAQGLTARELPEDGECFYDRRKIASISWSNTQSSAIVFVRSDLSYDGMHAVAYYLHRQFAPKDLSIIASYPAPRYISAQPEAGDDSGIRYLSSGAQGDDFPIPLLEPPSMATGLSAAFMSTAIESETPAVMILLPSSSTTPGAFATSTGAPADTIYDYGNGTLAANHVATSIAFKPAVTAVAAKLGWRDALGWDTTRLVTEDRHRSSQSERRQAGFGRLKFGKPYAEKTIGEGSMYL